MTSAPLGRLWREIAVLHPRARTALPDEGTLVRSVEYDSRRVEPGSLFVCLQGLRQDGHQHAARALAAGAVLALGEREDLPGVAPYAQVDDARKALALVAASLHDHPSRALTLVGVTGTNGKTSVTWMTRAILEEAGLKAAVIGTLGAGIPGELKTGPHTTPEAPELQAELARLRDSGFRGVALEVSSHGLSLRRTYGTRFDVVVFTNLTVDHLDFHGTMEHYAEAKNLLFRAEERGPEGPPAIAVVNDDDPLLPALLQGTTDHVLRFGRTERADVRLLEERLEPAGIWLRLAHAGGVAEVRSSLLGSFQVENLLAAFAVGQALGVPPATIASGLARVTGIPGRMERVDQGQPFLVVVDYAHTPDALRRALQSLRPFTRGREILVFGCGGERDRSKRSAMGQIAARFADRVILTDDNPRGEDPERIREEVRQGLSTLPTEYWEAADRAQAIQLAISGAHPGDTVLIAGKGHETVQIYGREHRPFDDRLVAADTIQRRHRVEGSG